MILEWLRFTLCAGCILFGVFISVSAVIGIFRFPFAPNSMHVAGMNDTLGIFFIFLGLIIKSGFSLLSLKFFVIIVFFWLAGPVSTHLICRLEITTNEKLSEHCRLPDDKGGTK